MRATFFVFFLALAALQVQAIGDSRQIAQNYPAYKKLKPFLPNIKDDQLKKTMDQVKKIVLGMGTVDEIKKGIDEINGIRRKLAKELKIANMAKLSWDEEYAKLVDKAKCGYFQGSEKEKLPKFRKVSISKFEEDLDTDAKGEGAHFGIYEFLTPQQSKVGCGPLKCGMGGAKDWAQCYLGPVSELKDAEKDVKTGEAGSDCKELKNDDGLCSGSDRSELLISVILSIFLVAFIV